jgi:O-antigen ligase
VAVRTLLRASPGAFVLAVALPIVLVHIDYQPGFRVSAGSTHVHVVLSDLAVLACLLAAAAVAARHGLGTLRPGIPAWVALALLLALVVAACFYPRIGTDPYPWRDHLVTAAKYVEYALLAPAVVLLVRRREDIALLVATVVAADVVASAIAVAQFFGWGIVGGWPAGYRQPAFLGHHDFAALSGVALAVGLAAVALPGRFDRRLAVPAGIAGAIGLFLSGSLAGAIGLVAAAAVAAFVAKGSLRRSGAILGIALAVFGGVVLFRGGDVKSFLHQIGIGKKDERVRVESYVQRTMLAYYGWRAFLDHPAAGAGWQASNDEYVYRPFLPLLHRKYPHTPEQGFPSPQHPYGIQNAYVQALADLGVIGLALLLAALLTPLWLAFRTLVRGPPEATTLVAAMALLVFMAVLTALGLVAGIPTDGLLWLAVGLCATPALGAAQKQGQAEACPSE